MKLEISKERMKAAIARDGDCSVEAGIPPWVLRSNCCNAPMRVAGSEEGTRWHECVACGHACDAKPPNDPSSAARRTGGDDGNRDAPAGFAAAHG